ncbi:hypothetical protein D3C87_1025190 [compost metagenome]
MPALAHRPVETLRMLAGKFGNAGQFGDFEHPRIADVACAEGQVVTQAAGQQRQIVSDVADLLAQVSDIELAQVETVKQQLAFFGFIETHDQSRQGAFARTAAADDADPFTGFQAETDIAQCRRILAVVVKGHAADVERALQLRTLQRPLLAVAFLRQGHQRIGAFHGQLRLLIAGDQPGNLPQRR